MFVQYVYYCLFPDRRLGYPRALVLHVMRDLSDDRCFSYTVYTSHWN
jgi:hypothetical protein